DLDRLADDVSKMCSASPADVLMHVRALEQCIGWHLAHSNVVKLDSLGTFYPSITASTVETPDKVNQFSIKRLGVLFKPSERLKEMINKAGVKLADKRIFQAETHPMKKIAKEK
ncbi:MAG: HU family DNA-binding protein, partial [Bacteroidales bacterium]|nr:HU family DNA-binding protein [Bacteroidales bacterium]